MSDVDNEPSYEAIYKKAITDNLQKANNILEEINRRYRQSLEAHIQHHKYLLDMATEQGNTVEAARHMIMINTYEQMLKNQDFSKSYAKVQSTNPF